MKNDKKPI